MQTWGYFWIPCSRRAEGRGAGFLGRGAGNGARMGAGNGARVGAVVRAGWVQTVGAGVAQEWKIGGSGDVRLLGGAGESEAGWAPTVAW